ncbi:MAG TPA: glycosyltransferase, partial [Planctomycetota bacterium]|nr:glycosyltransferase [Planctomycetota bacterium]
MARKILFVTPPLGAGAEVYVEMAAGLNRRGFEMEILAPLDSRAHHLDAGVRFHYFEVPEFNRWVGDCAFLASQFLWGSGAQRALERLEHRFDVVFAHIPWGLAKVYAHRRERPLVGLIEVCWSDSWPLFNDPAPAEPHPAWVNWKLACFLHEHTMRGFDRLIAPSEALRAHHAPKGLKNIDVIRYGRNPARYRHDADRAALRAKLGLPREGTVVLTVGLDFARKGMHHFAEVARRLGG